MRLFVDTEFTDFIDCDLVSIALVADDGREFYGERSDYDRASCNEFVRAAVLSQLGQYPDRVYTREALRAALVAWLDQFADESERVLCFDYGGDWDRRRQAARPVSDNYLGRSTGVVVAG
ncbi:3'-5' exoribonuclease [uncultured Paraburkholderia sp.]|uniref:3'-5' exoribonuclease n=1 Tax=uncultured Paraburkholderia sp. TaxID=1822466 RepID=UPI0025953C36|nr:3'-5' exoribonuclease [uncultured Paraburkholderia sp.]